MKIIYFAFVIHLIFLVSVFDVYFTTPIVHGIEFQQNVFTPPAKRLVLFVADGMRADTFFRLSANKTGAPFLRNVIERSGTWGVSHTRVPTESRPGHVALIAGLYEDPSAIAKGWKENPVEFDSVFNRSVYTWAWGSPDIVPMFSKACGDHMWAETYAAEDQDFSGGKKSTSWLDDWVFLRFESFMRFVKRREVADETESAPGGYEWKHIGSSGIIIFLHLLATDTAGHTFKPHSWEYQKNVNLLDNGVKRVVELVEDFFGNDGKTAYIFTADHGMTDWGSHGAGDASETQTPLIAWGAGVPGPVSPDSTMCQEKWQQLPDVDDEGWHLSGLCRHDVWQADIAPLMATLIGIPIPVNSVGYLRRPYLDLGSKEMAQAVFTNARQMLAQHTHRRMQLEHNQKCGKWYCTLLGWLPSFYQPFPALLPEHEALRVMAIQHQINAGNYKEAIAQSDQLYGVALSGLDYHHRYHRPLLLACTSLSFLSWICILLITALGNSQGNFPSWTNIGRGVKLVTDLPFALISALLAFYLFVLSSPLQYYVHCLLPFVLWWVVVRLTIEQSKGHIAHYKEHQKQRSVLPTVFLAAVYFVGIEILVLSFFYRWVLSLGMVGLALRPFVALGSGGQGSHRKDIAKSICWAGSCGILGIFPFMPIVGKEVSTTLVMVAGLLFVVLGMLGVVLQAREDPKPRGLLDSARRWPISLWLQLLLLLPLATWNIGEADKNFNEKKGLPLVCQILSWVLSGSSLALPLLSRWCPKLSSSHQTVAQQLLSVCLSMAVPFLLLSVNHEGLFLLALVLNVHMWVFIELNSTSAEMEWNRVMTKDDFRRSYTFIFLIVTSFFGTGNVASINSFDPAWVRRFLSVFSPHAMGALILAKTCIPFLIVSCAFRALNTLSKTPTRWLFLIVLAISDACGLHFLHLVKDKGSWMDIGSSLSHFVIQETMALFLLILYALSCALMPSMRCEDKRMSFVDSVISVPLSVASPESGLRLKGRWKDKAF